MTDATGRELLSSTPAVVLAGGAGTRLRAAVADRPKVLAEVRGRPFLSYLLEQLAAAGCQEAILSTGYMAEQVEAAFGEGHAGLRLRYAPEPEPLGTAGGLRHALPIVEGETVLVLNGDSYCEADLPAFRAGHAAANSPCSLVVVQVPQRARYGTVRLDAEDRVLAFEEKDANAEGPGWINAGVYLLSRELIEAIPSGRAVSLERECFPAWIAQGLRAHRTRGEFIDIGTPASYQRAARFFEKVTPP